MLTDAELAEIFYRLEWGITHWRDRAKLRQHIEAQAARIAQLENHVQVVDASNVHLTKLAGQLRAEVDALKRETQAPDGWHKLFVATPTLPVEISVNGVPVPLNGHGADEVGA